MKITIGGSMTFAKKQIEASKYLKNSGHEVLLTDDIEHYLKDKNIKLNFEEELEISKKYDIIRTFFNKIVESDALLIINHDKKGISGYIGTSVIMEIGLAYFLKKKIYLLKEVDKNQNYALEIALINPIILNGDLSKVK